MKFNDILKELGRDLSCILALLLCQVSFANPFDNVGPLPRFRLSGGDAIRLPSEAVLW
jgi:hypothetical protein